METAEIIQNKTVEIVQNKTGFKPKITTEKINSYLDSLGSTLSPKHRTQFIEIAILHQLNPFIREIYGIPYGNNFNIIVGYEVFLKRAERSGQLQGWQVETQGTGNAMKAICTIHRKDWEHPLIHEVAFSEYAQSTAIWKSKPQTMIKKVAIAQAFRFAFPCDLGGMPYTAEEVPYKEVKTLKEKAPNTITDERLNKGIEKVESGEITKEQFTEIIKKSVLTESQLDKVAQLKK